MKRLKLIDVKNKFVRFLSFSLKLFRCSDNVVITKFRINLIYAQPEAKKRKRRKKNPLKVPLL